MPWAHLERLAAHPQLWVTAADQFGSAVALIDRHDLTYLVVNDAMAQMNGVSVEDHIGRSVPEVMPAEHWAWLEPLYERVFDGENVSTRYTDTIDGRLRAADVRLSPVREDGDVAAVLVVVTDVSVGETMRRHSDQLLVLALELNLARELGEIAEAVAAHSRHQLGAVDAGVYWRADPDSLVRLSRESVGTMPVPGLERVELDERVPVADVVKGGHASWLEQPADWDRYPSLRAAVHDMGWPVVGVIPLRATDEVRGALYLTFEGGREVPSHERQAVQTLAALCASAVERLVRAERARAVEEDRQRLSQTVQTALLPTLPEGLDGEPLPVVSAYQPGDERLALGGDFYDVVRRPDGRLGLLVGDVCGHGPLAAAIGAACRLAWRTGMLSGADLVMAVGLVDLVLRSERDDDGTFATIISATYDSATGDVELLSAGHPPPVLLDPVTGHRTLELDQGPLLGVFDRAEHVVNRRRLAAGQSMLLYTDGLIEGRSRPGSSARLDDEGLHELLRALPPDDLRHPQRIIDAANLRHGADLPDDVALLVLVAPTLDGEEPLGLEAADLAAGVAPLP